MQSEAIEIPIRIVLNETSHAGNIGASARAMKTMGLNELCLVAPVDFPSAAATARASGADDILAGARVVDTLADAIADCTFVVGASARIRSLSWPVMDPRQCAAALGERAFGGRAAVVFGPEQSGLTNEDLARCQALVHIPSNPAYSSLNLAMSVQVICYELRMHYSTRPQAGRSGDDELREAPLATAEELEAFHGHLEAVMRDVAYLNPDHPRQLKLRLRRLFNRARLDQTEINILRGFLAAIGPRRVDRERDS